MGHLEAEGVVAGDTHAQIADHQRVTDLVVAQPVVGEPAQALEQRRVFQLRGEAKVERQALHLWRRMVEGAADAFVVMTVRGLGQHAPEQAVEGQRHCPDLAGFDALGIEGSLQAVFGGHASGQAQAQIGCAQEQRQAQAAHRPAVETDPGAVDHRHQQRHGVQRIDDEHRRPAQRREGQRPEQLRAVDGEGIEQRMRDQHQPERQEQPAQAVTLVGPALAGKLLDQPGEQQGEACQHENRMGETAVIGHLRDRIGVAYHHVQIRHAAQQRPVDQRAAALNAA